jgi:hypothetical protein
MNSLMHQGNRVVGRLLHAFDALHHDLLFGEDFCPDGNGEPLVDGGGMIAFKVSWWRYPPRWSSPGCFAWILEKEAMRSETRLRRRCETLTNSAHATTESL